MNPVKVLYNHAMGQLMNSEAKTHGGKFFTQSEYLKNIAKINDITRAKTIIDEQFKSLNR